MSKVKQRSRLRKRIQNPRVVLVNLYVVVLISLLGPSYSVDYHVTTGGVGVEQSLSVHVSQ